MSEQKLLPCPFCGCSDISKDDDGHSEWFKCDWCGATSGYDPATELEEEPASFHWNRRTGSGHQALVDAAYRVLDYALLNEQLDDPKKHGNSVFAIRFNDLRALRAALILSTGESQ